MAGDLIILNNHIMAHGRSAFDLDKNSPRSLLRLWSEIGLKKYSVVIFAAGMGKRLGSLGKRNPKCLLKINDSTLIEIITKKLFFWG